METPRPSIAAVSILVGSKNTTIDEAFSAPYHFPPPSAGNSLAGKAVSFLAPTAATGFQSHTLQSGAILFVPANT